MCSCTWLFVGVGVSGLEVVSCGLLSSDLGELVMGTNDDELGRREMCVKSSDSGVGERVDALGRDPREIVSWNGRRNEEILNEDGFECSGLGRLCERSGRLLPD